MKIEEICQLVPPVDKKLKNALKALSKQKSQAKAKMEALIDKNQSSQRQLRDSEKEGSLIK
jgi:hypothetical protein